MENKDWFKENWKYLAGIAVTVLLVRVLLKPKKKKASEYSNFIGSPFGKRVSFTLTNNTNEHQVVPLFNAYSNTQNANVGITPSISEFNRTLLNEPKKVTMIEVRAMGSKAQAEKPMQIYCKDASGQLLSSYLYPLVSAYQAQGDMTSVQPSNYILDGQCSLNYTVDPKKTVTLIFHYDNLVTEKSQPNKNVQDMEVSLAN